jgi:hypothetical protein
MKDYWNVENLAMKTLVQLCLVIWNRDDVLASPTHTEAPLQVLAALESHLTNKMYSDRRLRRTIMPDTVMSYEQQKLIKHSDEPPAHVQQ